MRGLTAIATLGGFSAALALLATATAHATTPTPTSPPEVVVQAVPNPAREAQHVTLAANRTEFGTTPHWSQVDGPSVRLVGADTLAATFTAPSVDRATTLVFRFSMPPLATSRDVEVLVLPANAVIVTIPETEGPPAGVAEVGVILDPVGLEVAELHHRLGFTEAAAVADRGDGTPDCSAAADFDTATFAFLPQGCVARHACTQVRADIDFAPTRTTAGEAYRCRIAVSPLPADTCQHPLTCAGGTGENAAGAALQLTCTDGTVTSRYDHPEPIFTLRTEPATPQVGADFLLVFSIEQLVGGLEQYSLNGLWPLLESVSTVPDTGTPGEVAYTVRPLLAGTAYPSLGVSYEVTGGCPGNEFFYFEFAHSQDFALPIQDPHGVRVSGRVAELPGCDGTAVGREVQMEPGRYAAHSDLAAGEFSFAGVSPGNYAIGVRPTCNDFGCWPDVWVNVGSEDVFITLCPKTLACTGDCNGDRRVTIDELIRGVGMALDMIEPAATCGSFDIDASGLVQINELITAVNAALDGCSGVNNTDSYPDSPSRALTRGPALPLSTGPRAGSCSAGSCLAMLRIARGHRCRGYSSTCSRGTCGRGRRGAPPGGAAWCHDPRDRSGNAIHYVPADRTSSPHPLRDRAHVCRDRHLHPTRQARTPGLGVDDAVVVGSGPNGLAAAVELARGGARVRVVEAGAEIGGGTRSAALTLPGYLHDVCSGCHPTGILSPFFRRLPLEAHGLRWAAGTASAAHPLDAQPAVLLRRSLDETAADLGVDAAAYQRFFAPFLRDPHALLADLLAPLRLPTHPFRLARFGVPGLLPATALSRMLFRGDRARALLAGCAAHAILPLERPLSAAVGMIFALTGHVADWPVAVGGSQAIAAALASYLRELGGAIDTGVRVRTVSDLPPARVVLFDTDPAQLAGICGSLLPPGYVRRLRRYRYGPGVFKLDWALDGPIPWRDPRCLEAATVHVGGTLDEITAAEAAVWRGEHPPRPFVMVVQQSQFDPSRAPAGRHTGYAYVHVPHGSNVDMTGPIEAQLERFAPGFGARILARHRMTPADLERDNPNYVGGAITGGVADLFQFFTRPVARLDPYSTPHPRLFICSASTPPGGGVHGMCGYFAARSALRRLKKLPDTLPALASRDA